MSTELRQNFITKQAGLTFNVKAVRASIKKYYEQRDWFFEYEDKEGEVQRKLPTFQNSQVAVAAFLEELTKLLLKNVLPHVNKDRTGMKMITRPLLKYSVCMYEGFNKYYNYKLNHQFDKNMVYVESVPVSSQEMNHVIDGVDRSLKLTPRAENFLYFLLHVAYHDVVSLSYEFISYANKRTLNARSIEYAVKNLFPDTVSFKLCNELNRAVSAVKNEEDGEDEEKGKKKGKTVKRGRKQSTKAKQIEEDEYSEDDEDSEDNEEDEDSEDEEVELDEEDEEEEELKEPPKPKKRASKKASSRKKTTPRKNVRRVT